MADDVLRILEYLDASGQSAFARWFGRLNPNAAGKVTIALYRLEHGNFSNVKGVSADVYEYKIDFGPGYRIYFGKDGDRIVILLGGSDKIRTSGHYSERSSGVGPIQETENRSGNELSDGENNGSNKRF